MINIRNIFFFCFLFFATNMLFAQPGGLPSEEVEVIKDFEARLADSEKINVIPELPNLDSTSRTLTYNVLSRTMQVDYPAPKIRPLAMRGDKEPHAYDGFVKLGYGLPSSPFGELAYNNTKNKDYDVGGHLKYHSANRKSLEHQRFTEVFGRLNGTYYWEEGYALSGNMGYRMDEVHFYGYDHDLDSYSREAIRQQLKLFDVNAKLFNGTRTVGDINYGAEIDFYSLLDNFASKETGFDLNLSATKWISGDHPLTININTDLTNFKDTVKHNLHNFKLQPNFTFHGEIFKVKVGVNVVNHDDVFRFYPNVEASANVVGNQLTAYAGAGGDLYKNNFKNLSDYNPFMVSRFNPKNTDYRTYYGGVKGNLKIVDYQIQAGYKQSKDLAMFLNDPVDTIRFNVLYDTVNIFNIEGNLEAMPIKNLRVLISLSQNFYSPRNQEEAWHLPATEFNIGAQYLTLRDKLLLKGELYIQNGVHYVDLQGNQDKLNALFDISLGAEYTIKKDIGVFIELNNLVSNKRQRWFRYPTYGANFLAGVVAKFGGSKQ